MQTNNRGTIHYGSTMDKLNRLKSNRKAAETYQEKKLESTKDEIKKVLELIYTQKEFVKDSDNIVVSKNTWKTPNNSGNIKDITDQLQNENILNFFEVISGKSTSSDEFLGITLDNLATVTVATQISSANESLVSWQESVDYFNDKVKAKNGTIIGWDLETTGGKDLNGIWRPDSITEFAMQEYNIGTNSWNKTSVLIGLTADEGSKIQDEIIKAIENGTIDNNERLRIAAVRYSKYGHKDFSKAFNKDAGYYYVTGFPKDSLDSWKDIEAIKKGISHFVEVGANTRVENGIRADHRAVMSTVNRANQLLAGGSATLMGYNDSKFDKVILESEMMKWTKNNPALANLFDNNKVGLFVESNQWIDMFGGVKNFTDYNPIGALYPNTDMSSILKVRGQEYIAQAHLGTKFTTMNLRPHMAEDDVTALIMLATEASEITPNKNTFLDYIHNGISKVKTNKTTLNPGQHILRAKKGAGQGNDGRNYLNFAHSLSTGEIYTSDNHVISGNKVWKENFSAGYGVNKGGMYDVINISKFSLDDKLRQQLGSISPEYSGRNLYRVQLSAVMHDDYKNMRGADLVQNMIFKSEKEMQAFLSGNFDVVAERTGDGFKIADGMQDHFKRREISQKSGKAHLEVVGNNNASDTELVIQAIKADNEKRAVSRADNNLFKDKSYKKITKALGLKNNLEKELGQNISGYDMLALMSADVASGNMPLGLNNSQVMRAQEIIANTLEYNKGNMKRLLQSSIDNNAMGIEMLSTQENMLNSVINAIESLEGWSNQTDGYKQQLFSRVVREVKNKAAEHVYKDINVRDKMLLGDRNLEASLNEFRNIFEIDYTGLLKGDKVSYVDIANPSAYSNVLKLDITDPNSATFGLIDKATEIIHGKDFKKQGPYEADAINKMFNMLNSDRALRDTSAFLGLTKKYGYSNGRFGTTPHQFEIAETIISGMREIKSHNATNGIINFDHAFMKRLQGHSGFGAVLNSEGVLSQIPNIVNSIAGSFKYTELSSDEHINSLAQSLVSKHYLPSLNKIKSSKNYIGNEDVYNILHKNLNSELTTYMADIIKSATSIDGTQLSIQENGNLVLSRLGNVRTIDNLPRIALDDQSGTLFMQLGSMKIQVHNNLTFDQSGSGIAGGVASNIASINDFSISKNVRRSINNEGYDAAFDSLIYGIGRVNKDLRQMATINGFGGNDIDSNRLVGLKGIQNVLGEMFNENGSLNHYIKDQNFIDKELVETLRGYYNLDNLGPEQIRDLSKNMETIIDVIRGRNTGLHNSDFLTMSTGLGFTAGEKKTSNLMAIKGNRSVNSTLSVFDNLQRPPVTQSGNAYYLRVDDILSNNKSGVGAGNVITSANMENRLMRNYSGMGLTTTDVMMNITYTDNKALDVIFNNNFNRVINENNVDKNTREQMARTYNFVKERVSTYEQERIIDSRVHEQVYGLKTAATQKLSKNNDLVSLIDTLDSAGYDKQVKALLEQRGNFGLSNGNIVFNSSPGKILKRGESAIQWQGFAGISSPFASKMHRGVFNYNFYESDGTKLRVNEINALINQNKGLFMENGKLKTQAEMIGALDKLMSNKGIRGQFAIEDIAAIGDIKTMTAAEKGMTNIVYASTGSHDSRVQGFFKGIGAWGDVKSKAITDEALEAYYNQNIALSNRVLKSNGFNSINDLRKAMASERHTYSEMLFDKILQGSTHVLANDALGKHGNVGQMYQGTMAKAINSLTKQYGGDQGRAVDFIINAMQQDSYNFMGHMDLNNVSNFSSIGLKNKGGKLFIDEGFVANQDTIASLNAGKFKNLLGHINSQLTNVNQSDRLVANNVYTFDSDGGYFVKQDNFFGAFNIVQQNVPVFENGVVSNKVVNTIAGTNTRENFKYVRDAETQTGVTAEYFQLKTLNRNLTKQKINLEATLNATTDNKARASIKLDLMNINNQLSDVKDNLSSFDTAVKTMRLGDQEMSIIERIAITDSHVAKVNELIDSGELSSSTARNLAGASAFQGKARIVDGKMVFDGELVNQRVMGGWAQQLKNNQFYDSFSEDLLTSNLIAKGQYSHLKGMYDYANKHGLNLGVDSAEYLYQLKLADKASQFNIGKGGRADALTGAVNGYTVRNIRDVNLDLDDVYNSNIILDLGDKFESGDRYLAMPGLGKKVKDEEVFTNYQKEMRKLQYRINSLDELEGINDPDRINNMMQSVINGRKEAVSALDKSLYGKNGFMHSTTKIETGAVSYRLKASGIVTGTISDEMQEAAQRAGIDLSSSASYTRKALVNDRTIADWETSGEGYFKYKFASRQQFEQMGMFTPEKLKAYGFKSESEMEEFLRTQGLMDLSDRYPNIKNESLGLTNIYLGDDLANNQTKVSINYVKSANADFDGDSISSMMINFTGQDGTVYDSGMYRRANQLAKQQGVNAREYAISSGMMTGDVYDQFAGMEGGLITDGITYGKTKFKSGFDDVLKDYAKNQHVSNPDQMVLVPGGKSILGQHAFAGIGSMPGIDEFYRIENEANKILSLAGMDADIRRGNSAEALDKALSIISENNLASGDEFKAMQATAIRRAGIDKYSQEIMAKTGLAATGSVNLSLNAVKLAAYASENSASDIAYTNYVWSVLDTAEQGVISSKKMEGGGYDDPKIRDFKKAMKDVFDGKGVASYSSIQGVGEWLSTHGDKVFEKAYDEMGDMILSASQRDTLSKLDIDARRQQGTVFMKGAFLDRFQSMTGDQVAMSYMHSFKAMGRNGINTGEMWRTGDIDIAGAKGGTLTATTQGFIGYADEAQLDAALSRNIQAAKASEQAALAKESLQNGSNAKQAFKAAVDSYATSSQVAHSVGGNGLGKLAIGVAAGLMVGGYASGNPLNDKSAQQVSNEEVIPQQTMSIPDFMEKESGYVTGNSQQGYIINIRADTKKGQKHMQKIMSKAAEATVGGAVSVNMNIKNVGNNGITDRDIENYLNRNF